MEMVTAARPATTTLVGPAMQASSRSVVALARQTASRRCFSASAPANATLRELESRVKSVKNIEKITKSMKMIATTRLNKAQEAMKTGKVYGEANNQVFENAEVSKNSEDEKTLWIVVSSDRGLCGGIHSAVSKRAKREIASGSHRQDPVVVLGDKPKAQLSRSIPENLVLTVNGIGRSVPTFQEACAVAEKIEESGVEFDKVNVIYNRFLSVISYESVVTEVFNASSLKQAANFAAYEVEDEGLIGDLTSFALANAIYTALVEGHAAEISSRRNAMDNASKNAGEMIGKLQMEFNRRRQATITNELVDIVTGANAL